MGTLQGIHHSNILGGKGWLQAPTSGADAPAGHSPRCPGWLLWLSNGPNVRLHTKTWLRCWCCHDASGAGRQQGASGSCRRDGTLSSRETKQKSGREEQKSIVFGLFISNSTWCQGLPGRFVRATLLFSCHLFLREPTWKLKQQSSLPVYWSSKIIKTQPWCHAKTAEKYI